MSNLVFISGDFSSGSTLAFTLFRKTREYYCIYEPLHEKLLEYLIWPMESDEHHYFIGNYYAELKGFREIPKLFKPEWGLDNLYMPSTAKDDELYRYLNYLIGTAFGRADKVMLKENRITFRLGWLRAKFPHAKIVHIHREKQSQWNSMVQRVQVHHGREDVGQSNVGFTGFNIARWCEQLKPVYPQLAAENFKTGYERFSALWDLSFAENQRYADISVDYWELTHNFEETFEKVRACIGGNFEVASLKEWVVPKEKQKERMIQEASLRKRARNLFDRAGRKYAKARLLADSLIVREKTGMRKSG